MKTAIKVFLIISIVVGAFNLIAGIGYLAGGEVTLAVTSLIMGICPIIIGSITLGKISSATSREGLTGLGVVVLLFCNLIAGILILVSSDRDYAPKQPYNTPYNPYGNPNSPYGNTNNPYGNTPYGTNNPYTPNNPYGGQQTTPPPYNQSNQTPYGGSPYSAPNSPYGNSYGVPYGQQAPQQNPNPAPNAAPNPTPEGNPAGNNETSDNQPSDGENGSQN